MDPGANRSAGETVDDEGFEPSTFRMQNGRSTTELNAPHALPPTFRVRNGRPATAEPSAPLKCHRLVVPEIA